VCEDEHGILFYNDAARRSSDETCFIFERCLLLDNSKMLVFLNILKENINKTFLASTK